MDKQHIDNFQYQKLLFDIRKLLELEKHGWKNRETELEQITDYQIAKRNFYSIFDYTPLINFARKYYPLLKKTSIIKV